MSKNNLIPKSNCFCVIALQNYIEILKIYRKGAISLQKFNFSNFEKNVMPNFYNCMLNGVAIIAWSHRSTYQHTYIHRHILPNLGNT